MCGFEGPFDPFSAAITAVRAAAAWFNSLDGQPNQRPAKMHGVTGKDIDSPAQMFNTWEIPFAVTATMADPIEVLKVIAEEAASERSLGADFALWLSK
jgi:hypothetical protein